MTNYNKRLDELEEQFLADYRNWNDGLWDYNGLDPKQKFHQAITSLIKELVADAKPGKYSSGESILNVDGIGEVDGYEGYNHAIDQFEHNLLKELENGNE